MKECITLTNKEQRRLIVVSKMDRGELTAPEAGRLLGRSVRQGASTVPGLPAGRSGWPGKRQPGAAPAHMLPAAVREQVVWLAQTTYAGCNDSHLTELLAERDAIQVSRATVRRWRCGAGLASPQRRRPPRHRSRREGRRKKDYSCCNGTRAHTPGWRTGGRG